MKPRRTGTVLAAFVVAALLLSGCTSPELVQGASVTVAVDQPFFSNNPKTSYGNSTANSSIVSATNSQFNYYDNTPKLVKDDSFGSYQVVSSDPFQVKYTIRDGVKWSDGTPVDGADLLLAWAANSGNLNTTGFDASDYVDQRTGQYTEAFPRDVVHFDGSSGNGLQLVTKTPVIGDGGRSLTLSYDKYFVDWELVFGVGLPAHVVAGEALGIEDHQAAKAAMISAIDGKEQGALEKISRFWNSGFNFTSMPKDRALVVGSGPYVISDLVADQYVTLRANHRYVGDHQPKFETVTIRFISDPLAAVSALKAGDVDVIAPQSTVDVAQALVSAGDVTVLGGFDGAYEHVDLQFANSKNGTFSNPLVRQAFLAVVPRQQILDSLVLPLQEDAQLRSSQVFLPGSDGYAEAVEANGSERYAKVNVAAARALLAEAGVSSPRVCILFDPTSPRSVSEFGVITKSAAQAGFDVTDCSSPDWSALLGAPGVYDASLYAQRPSSLGVTSAAASFRSAEVGSTQTPTNFNHYSNPEVDALFDRLESATDPSTQRELLTQVDTILWSDAYGVPLYQYPSLTAFGARVANVTSSPLAPNVLWNIWAWKPARAG